MQRLKTPIVSGYMRELEPGLLLRAAVQQPHWPWIGCAPGVHVEPTRIRLALAICAPGKRMLGGATVPVGSADLTFIAEASVHSSCP